MRLRPPTLGRTALTDLRTPTAACWPGQGVLAAHNQQHALKKNTDNGIMEKNPRVALA
jgi:hypothetical protein